MKKTRIVINRAEGFVIAAAVIIAAGAIFASCGNRASRPIVLPETSEDKRFPENFDRQVAWDVLDTVDAGFPFDQYIEDQHEKWYLGRQARLDWWHQFPWVSVEDSMNNYETLQPVVAITGIDAVARTPVGNEVEAVTLMMATGDFPDMITLDPEHFLTKQLIEGGYVYSINELAERFDPGFYNNFPENVRRAGTYDDGSWWGVTGMTVADWQYEDPDNPFGLGNIGYNVRLDIWDALGRPSIATPDDLYNTLVRFKQEYPTLGGRTSVGIGGYGDNGKAVLITMQYSFGIRQWVTINPDTNEVTIFALDPKYPEFVAFMNRLYREGLLDPEFFVKDLTQQVETFATNAFMMPWVYHALDSANNTLRARDPNSVFVAIPPMTAVGDRFQFGSSGIGFSLMGGASMTMIPRRSKDPEAALRLIRYGFSPAGSLQLHFGNPGTYFYVDDNIVTRSPMVLEAMESDFGRFVLQTGLRQYYALVFHPLREALSATGTRLEFDIPNTFPYAYDSTIETYHMQPMPSTDEGIAYNMSISIADRDTALAITAATAEESERIVSRMQDRIRSVPDYNQMVLFLTDKYAENLERFGAPRWGNPHFNR